MMFFIEKESILNQFKNPEWLQNSGIEPEQLKKQCRIIATANAPRSILKSQIFECILDNAQISICYDDLFVDQINHCGIMQEIRESWKKNAFEKASFPELTIRAADCFAYTADEDFGHVAPDWEAILQLGIPGILERLEKFQIENEANHTLNMAQTAFYEASIRSWRAVHRFVLRLFRQTKMVVENANDLNLIADNLQSLAERPPKTMHEAMQLMFIVYFLLTSVEGENIRSLGMLDRLLYPFYQADLRNGIATRESEKELLKYFMYRFYAMDVIANIPFGICGTNEVGIDQTNELSYLILEAYAEMNIPSPKIHIMCNSKTPEDILCKALDTIRKGNSSILFANDDIITKALLKIGISQKDAANHLLVGCYEPAVIGKEIPCSCNGRISLPKAVEYAITNGVDLMTGEQIGRQTGDPESVCSFEQFLKNVLVQYENFADAVMEKLREIEKKYDEINPAPLLSATLKECVERGVDAYSGGAKYNNSSINVFGLATAVDSLHVIKKIVFEQKRLSLQQLRDILKEDWHGHEYLQIECKNVIEKYGNNKSEVDTLAKMLAEKTSTYLNGKPNGRGGCFRCGMFSIDWRMIFGQHTGASADGRNAGEPLSKNIGASTAMDKNGITALIQSASKLDYSQIPNGTVLDLLLHPTTVLGTAGMTAMQTILHVYFEKGGFALHCNVFDAQTLKKAQLYPSQYATLQVRLCGWNVYFVNLTREEQDEFIRQASMNH